MNTNFRELISMPKLKVAHGAESISELPMRHRKAIRNIKYCAEDQWQFVNSWYDSEDEHARRYILSANTVFVTIYQESLTNLYDEGMVRFGKAVEAELKDIRFCGKFWLQLICLYYTAKLIEEAFYEVEGTEEDAIRIVEELKQIKEKVLAKSF